MLYLINENVCGFVGQYQRFDVLVQGKWIAQLDIVIILEVEIQDLFGAYSIVQQPVAKDFHNSGFSAAAYSCYHLYQLFIFESDELVEIVLAFNSLHCLVLFWLFATNIQNFMGMESEKCVKIESFRNGIRKLLDFRKF